MTGVVNVKKWIAPLSVATVLVLAACGGDDPAKLMASARDYQAKNDHGAAIIQLKNVLQKQPENGEARLMLARSAMTLGDPATAEKEYRKALEYGQAQGDTVPMIVAAMVLQGNADKAITEFAGRKLDNPKADAQLRARLGDAYISLGRTAEASDAYAAALALDPATARALLGQARLKAAAGNLDEATAEAERIAASSTSLDALDAWLLAGEIKVGRGDRTGARAALQKAIDASPATPGPRLNLIAMLIADGQLDDATAQLAAARTARAPELPLLYLEALIAFSRKDLAKSRELVQQVLKRAPAHVPSMVLLGAIDFQNKQFTQAASELQAAVTQAPKHTGARALLARTYLASGKPARAVEVLAPIADSSTEVSPALLLLIGEAYFANGDLKQASAAFERASSSSPQRMLARTGLAQVALASGDVEGGVRRLESLAAEEGAPEQTEMALLTGYLRQGNTAKALEVAQAMVKKRPNDPAARQALGSVFLLRKDVAAGRAEFAKALELNPTYMPAVASLAQLDMQAKDFAAARGRFDTVLAKDPKNESALLGLAEVMLASRAPIPDVVAVLQRAVAAQPESVSARVALVNLLLRQRDNRAALTAAQEASAAVGKDSRILDALGRAQLAAGDTNQATETFTRLAAAEPGSPVPLVRLASVYLANKEPQRAADTLLRAKQLAPNDPNIVRDLVAVYVSMGKTDQALAEAKAMQSKAPQVAAGWLLEGDVYASAKQWPAAEKAYRQALQLQPQSNLVAIKLHGTLVTAGKKAEAGEFVRKWLADNPKDGVVRGYLAEQALLAGDFKAASAQYLAALEVQPENVVYLNNLAWSLGKLGDPRAMTYAERALALAPDDPVVLDTVGNVLAERGDKVKSVEYLARAVQLAPDRPDIRFNYAKALLKAGRTEDARKELVRLEGVSQDFPGKAEVPKLLGK